MPGISNPERISIATTTFYPRWEDKPAAINSDNVRGDLALRMIETSLDLGYQISVVDGGSSADFVEKVWKIGSVALPEQEHTMSGSRRQVLREAAAKPGAEVVAWVEPEKVSIPDQCAVAAARPILEGQADITIPRRDELAFATYPDQQVAFEKRSNSIFNAMLRGEGLLSERQSDLDMWIGPRFIKNDPELLELFQRRYEFVPRKGSSLDELVEPELWPNAIFFPVVAALVDGYNVGSVPVNYRHPEAQTVLEKGHPEFERKRDIQFKNIIVATKHYMQALKELNGQPTKPSQIRLVYANA